MTWALPIDIDREIFTRLSKDDQTSFASVNPTFLSIARTYRFKRVVISCAKDIRNLLRLIEGDPLATSTTAYPLPCHIRELRIKPWPILPGLKCSAKHIHQRPWTVMRRIVDSTFDARTAEQQKKHVLDKYLALLLEVLSRTVGITHLSIEWDGDKDTYSSKIFSFLTGSLSQHNHSLTELDIHISVEWFKYLPEANLYNLDRLAIGIYSGNMSQYDLEWHLHGFRVFLQNASNTLTSFTLYCPTSSVHLDISSIFEQPRWKTFLTFPRLHHFCLQVPFDGTNLKDMGKLSHFLKRHANTLSHLHLRCNRYSEAALLGLGSQHDNWMDVALSYNGEPIIMRALDTVELPLRPLHATLDKLVFCEWLSLHASQLRSITCTERTLRVEEAQRIMDSFLHPYERSELQHLELKVTELTTDLLDQILRKFTCLKSLVLYPAEMQRPPTNLFAPPESDPMTRMIESMIYFGTNLANPDYAFGNTSLQTLCLKCKKRMIQYQDLIRGDIQRYFPQTHFEMFEDDN